MKSTIIFITPGRPDAESGDWADMLCRMYVRWAEQQGHAVKATQWSEDGTRPAMIRIAGKGVLARLVSEHGIHELTRISPFLANANRVKVSALVKVLKCPADIVVRSYVTAPYTLVKDTRTLLSTGDVDNVLNGGVEMFVAKYEELNAHA